MSAAVGSIGREASEEPSGPLPFLELPYFNGLGGFTPDGREYAIYLGPGARTRALGERARQPGLWRLVSESGTGLAWAANSQANRLIPWSNDPGSGCPPVRASTFATKHLGVFWSPTAAPMRGLDAYRARHGQGYTVFEHNSHAVSRSW